jgi:hypothetical protein
MAKGKILKSCSVTFKEGMDPVVELHGIWTRRELDTVNILLRRALPRNLAEARNRKEMHGG